MPADQRQPLIDAIMTSDSELAEDVRKAISDEHPGIDLQTDLKGVLKGQTHGYDLTTPQLKGTRDYVEGLNADPRTLKDPPAHLSADSLTLAQMPGFKGIGQRAYKGAGQAVWGNILGYGVTSGLDYLTGREVQMPTWEQGGLDLTVSLASNEAERALGNFAATRIGVSAAASRGLLLRAGPGFVVQPVVSVGMEEFSLESDEELYARLGLEMSSEEKWSRRAHAAGVGLAGAGASLGALYVIGKFTAGGAGVGAVGGGVGAAPGAVVGFLIGTGVVLFGAAVAYGADKALPGGRETFMKEHEEELQRRYQKEKERLDAIKSGQLPMQTIEGSQVPLPFRLSPDISVQEQAAIASYLMANAQR